ncbi:hypothetical protein AURDEDRAFT_177214 [Auricularia subglabra TFB-10046 SS5]|uniref:Holliday junction resolvase Gen1 C-terminal domain-containing protein n=1 Tax=Auricularia subglabra (strain TFB-10046 / SS5) TaxID=717982 RepID=J0WMX1_AURST|nr:hypothetical protein AURDEDRAFT_177214 [Auricularia subglabra TFB-10046 SS5]
MPVRQLPRLMLVSRYWRSATACCPTLWTVLALHADAAVIGALDDLLNRSRRLPLSLSLTIPLASEHCLPGICTSVVRHLARIYYLGIHGRRISFCSSIFDILRQPAPNLRLLDLSPIRNRGGCAIFPLRLDDDDNTDHLLANVAPQLRFVDLGLLRLPQTPQAAISGVRELTVGLTSSSVASFADLLAQAPILETLIVKDYTSGTFLPCPPPGHRIASIEIQKTKGPALSWHLISGHEIPTLCVKQRHAATYEAVLHALADDAWQILSLTMDYGLAITAEFRAEERIRRLQTFDAWEHPTVETTCEKLMYERRCLSRIQHLTLSLDLEPVDQMSSDHLLPHLRLPALTILTLLCGASESYGQDPADAITLLDEWVLSRCSALRAPDLRSIRLAARITSSSHLARCGDRYPARIAAVSPSRLARFIALKLDNPQRRPELRVDAPSVYLLNDRAGLLGFQLWHFYLTALAEACERSLGWHDDALLKRFKSLVWPGAVMRMLRDTHLRPSSAPRVTNRATASLIQSLIIGIHGQSEHASTDYLQELRVEINTTCFVQATQDKVGSSCHAPDVPDDLPAASNNPKALVQNQKGPSVGANDASATMAENDVATLRVWLPACVVQLAAPQVMRPRSPHDAIDKEAPSARFVSRKRWW